jgi:hypothetical protein
MPDNEAMPQQAAPSAQPPMPNLQDTQKRLSQTIYDLGRAKYEHYIAESKVNALQAQAADLAVQANNLQAKIAAEIQAATATK